MSTYLGHDRDDRAVDGDLPPAATAALAQWAAGLDWPDLTEPVVRKSQQGILDTVGVALGGSRHPAAALVAALVDDLGGVAQATAIGRDRRTSAQLAALHNAYVAHVLDFDDTHLDAIVHVNVPVLAAALAVSELSGGDGRELILAHVAGLEVSSRVGIAVTRREPYGWHPTGVAGCFGATVAAGRLLELDTERMRDAIGVVSTLASGLRGHRGTMAKGMSPANAASNGVVAALAARHGMTASPTIIEDPDVGYLVSHGLPITAVRETTDQLGQRYRMLDWEPKPYPCGVVIHPAVDAAQAALEAGPGSGKRIARVELEVHPLALELTGRRKPSDGLEAKFSVFHAVASVLLAGVLLPEHFEDDWAGDATVIDLRDRVEAVPDPSLSRDEATAVIHWEDGTTGRAHQKAKGTRDRRMTDDDVTAKFTGLARPVVGPDRTDAILRAVADLPTGSGPRDLLAACVVEGVDR